MSSQGLPGARGPRGFLGPPGPQVRNDQMTGGCYQRIIDYNYKQMKRDYNFISILSG